LRATICLWRLLFCSLSLTATLSTTSVFAADSIDRTTLVGSAPYWATSANYVAAADTATDVGFRVYLGWTNPAAAEALARAVSDPHSISYGQFLTPNQFRSQFSPAANDVAKVENWLRGQGFSVIYSPQNNHYLAAEGSVAQLAAAFGTQFGLYNVQGQTVRSPVTEVSIPSTLAGVIKAVIGLDESYQFVETHRKVEAQAPPTAGFRNASPLPSHWAGLTSLYAFPAGFTSIAGTTPWSVKGYTPDQIRGAYGISGFDGSGQTVAIVDAYGSPTILQDVNQWSTNRGLPTMTPAQLVQVVPPGVYKRPQNPKQNPQAWYGEETLDVEAVHGMAPGAKIVYVGAPNNYQDLDAAINHVVDQHLAQIVTNSYGFPTTELLPPGYILPMEDTLIQAAIEGIGVYFSSGGSGDETVNFGFATTDWPASSPWVTAVGGTSLGIGAAGTRVLETGWGTSNYNCNTRTLACARTGWDYGGGGGVSAVFNEPGYQQSTGLTLSGRGVPDVAALADPQAGLLVGQTQTFPDGVYYDEYRAGGTSLASPIFAGLMALADQKAGRAHGFANPLLYDNPAAFYDVVSIKTAVARRNFIDNVDATAGTVDRLRTFDDYSGSPTQHTAVGWDNVTGLGSPGTDFLSLIGQ
jgi:subtilase family serine protease